MGTITNLKKSGTQDLELRCKTEFKKLRDKIGITCRNCGNKHHYWISTIELYKCANCGTKSTLRSGTLLEKSKLPYRYWYHALRIVHSRHSNRQNTKGVVSNLQEKLGHKRYSSIWEMVDKINKAVEKESMKNIRPGLNGLNKLSRPIRKITFSPYLPSTAYKLKKIITA